MSVPAPRDCDKGDLKVGDIHGASDDFLDGVRIIGA
jgi:hypothetical protein